jgi:molybdenum cofactor cytidylyltransferase
MTTPAVAALLLAAGRSSRMGSNKLVKELEGKALIAHVADQALSADFAGVVVVTGHQAEAIQRALVGRPVTWVHNALYEEGMASSLKAGVEALPASVEALLVCLGDMPRVTAHQMQTIARAYDPAKGHTICVPVFQDQRGNPVLFGRQHFVEMQSLEGDRGGRSLLAKHADRVREVEMTDDAILTDVDTPESFARVAGESP